MKVVRFKEMSNSEWDAYLGKIRESTYLHASWYINYLNAINGKENCQSFILFDGNDPIAICPLSIFKVENFGEEYVEATFKGFPSIYPAVVRLTATQRRRTIRKVFAQIDAILKTYAVKRIEFYKHPMNLDVINGDFEIFNTAEAVSYGYFCDIKNSVIIDLKREEERLMHEMSQYQRKRIKKSKNQGLVIREYKGEDKDADNIFDDFRLSHVKSAGRLTRPIESWDIMKSLLKENKASLFTASIENGKNISYLYCGEFDRLSFGWSQVNIDEYETQYSPRHLLEWEAMMSYKKRGFLYYELGVKQDSPQFNYIPTEKEKSITQVKERYGGELYSWLHFEKFFDKDLFNKIYAHRLEKFLNSNYFLSQNEHIYG